MRFMRHSKNATMLLASVLLTVACSKAPEAEEDTMGFALVDKNGWAVEAVGKERATDLYLSLDAPNGSTVTYYEAEVSAVNCAEVSNGAVKMDNTVPTDGVLLNAVPIKVSVGADCQAGQTVSLSIAGLIRQDNGINTPWASTVILTITSLGPLPELTIVSTRINGVRDRPAVLFDEAFDLELTLKNEGRRDLTDALLVIKARGAVVGDEVEALRQNITLPAGESRKVPLPVGFKAKIPRKNADEIVFSLAWSVEGDELAGGTTELTLPVQRGFVIREFLQQLVKEQEEDALFPDLIPIDFVAANESDLPLPPSQLWIEAVKGGSIYKSYDRAKVRELDARERIFIKPGQLFIVPDRDSLDGLANPTIQLDVKWSIGDELYQGTQTLIIKSLKGNIWQPGT